MKIGKYLNKFFFLAGVWFIGVLVYEWLHYLDCGERWEGKREKAYRHAKKTGHKVNGEVVIAYRYN